MKKYGLKLGQIEPLKNREKGINSLSTGLSNCTLACVFNKGPMGGGSLAEGRRQRAAKIG
jgi:hypothetical protein